MSNELVKYEQTEEYAPISAKQLQQQVNIIQEAMKQVMKEGVHFGTIPGTPKPSLYKAGAEKLGMMFRLIPSFIVRERDLGNGHRQYEVICQLVDRRGSQAGQGVGICSTMESKYRWRKGERYCPNCGLAAIIKGKDEYGGGWVCFKKKGGCGSKFNDDDKAITDQKTDRVENEDLADQYNTILKMAKKRAHVDSIITATAASDIFTQDIEDLDIKVEAVAPVKAQLTPADKLPPKAAKSRGNDSDIPAALRDDDDNIPDNWEKSY